MEKAPEEKSEEKSGEKKFTSKDMLIEGCINDHAREVISQMLERRLAELDTTGQQAQFIIKLQGELNQMPTCADMLGEETSEKKEEEQKKE